MRKSISSLMVKNKLAGFSRTEHAKHLKPFLDREYIVPVLLKAIDILDVLKSRPDGLRVEEIHRLTGISKTTVYRILRTFVTSGYISQNATSSYVVEEAPIPVRQGALRNISEQNICPAVKEFRRS
jgi:predicted DNA-binding transcriptional regulator